jgi:hypothetical protein
MCLGPRGGRISNIAGKAYAMSLITPIDGPIMTLANKLIFRAVGTPLFRGKLNGLLTLSMIHYARWAIVRSNELPRLSPSQPEEDLHYSYMFFFSNFNGSWSQYVDSFSAAIPTGLDLLWWRNVGWPNSVPELPFHRYVSHNQLFTNHYYSAYPMAASNDVKAAKRVKDGLRTLIADTKGATPERFQQQYNRLLKNLQHDLGQLAPTPIVSLANEAAAERQRRDAARHPQSERVKVA